MKRHHGATCMSPSASSLSLAELLDGFRRACPIASAELIRRFGPRLLHDAERRLPSHSMRTSRTADDLVQDTLVALYRGLGERVRDFANEPCLISYLHRIMDRLVSHYLRASCAAKRANHGEEPLDVCRHDLVSRELGPAEAAAAADEMYYILAKLPRERRVLVEALYDGESLEDAAARLGIHANTARRWIEEIRITLGSDCGVELPGPDGTYPPPRKEPAGNDFVGRFCKPSGWLDGLQNLSSSR